MNIINHYNENENNNEKTKIYTLEELATYLTISVSKLRGLVRENKIPHFRIGNRIRFDSEDITSWIEKLKEKENKNTLYY